MRKPLPMRRRVRGMPCVLLAALLFLARLIAPATAMPAPVSPADAIEQIALHSLCHGAPAGDHAPAPAHHDCLLCPACHLLSHAAIPPPGGPALRPPARTLIGLAAPLPPATASPARPRPVAQPTGPPTPSV